MDPSRQRDSIEEMLGIGSSLREACIRRGFDLPEVETATLIRAVTSKRSRTNSSSFCPPARTDVASCASMPSFSDSTARSAPTNTTCASLSLEPNRPRHSPYPGGVTVRLLRAGPGCASLFTPRFDQDSAPPPTHPSPERGPGVAVTRRAAQPRAQRLRDTNRPRYRRKCRTLPWGEKRPWLTRLVPLDRRSTHTNGRSALFAQAVWELRTIAGTRDAAATFCAPLSCSRASRGGRAWPCRLG